MVGHGWPDEEYRLTPEQACCFFLRTESCFLGGFARAQRALRVPAQVGDAEARCCEAARTRSTSLSERGELGPPTNQPGYSPRDLA